MLRSLLLSAFAFVLMLCWTTAPLVAHHSFAAEFDGNKPVKVTDEVSGRSAVWGFSAGPPATLARRGIKRDVLKVGDTVKVDGFLAKDGSPNASGGKVTFADGRQVFTAAAEDAVPK